ncbi:hypothetical protein K504DRAFT_464134 [Pleomassaria siparia CBS 279.74]|uniref:2EXR domain-containing protein n=1 Tax=Pleomassaria siparia CBS 279.74 TaxID=1314801 RepID=A0A6G1KGS9_9PLEO|nr:hypothetical protein K504DRAFT_464134 [Pleomassaria siparia CBS 279.74]
MPTMPKSGARIVIPAIFAHLSTSIKTKCTTQTSATSATVSTSTTATTNAQLPEISNNDDITPSSNEIATTAQPPKLSDGNTTPTFQSFHLFPFLPLELRLQIWEEALLERTILAVVPNRAANKRIGTDRPPFITTNIGPPFAMTYIGVAPYMPGQSCKEARRVLERLYEKPIRGPYNEGTYWVHPDVTIVYLGDAVGAREILNSVRPEDVARFKHVGVSYHHLFSLEKTCERLAVLCPGLKSLAVQRDERNGLIRQGLKRETAIWFANMLRDARKGDGNVKGDLGYWSLIDYFDDLRARNGVGFLEMGWKAF